MDWGYFSINELPTPFDERVIKVIDNLRLSLMGRNGGYLNPLNNIGNLIGPYTLWTFHPK